MRHQCRRMRGPLRSPPGARVAPPGRPRPAARLLGHSNARQPFSSESRPGITIGVRGGLRPGSHARTPDMRQTRIRRSWSRPSSPATGLDRARNPHGPFRRLYARFILFVSYRSGLDPPDIRNDHVAGLSLSGYADGLPSPLFPESGVSGANSSTGGSERQKLRRCRHRLRRPGSRGGPRRRAASSAVDINPDAVLCARETPGERLWRYAL